MEDKKLKILDVVATISYIAFMLGPFIFNKYKCSDAANNVSTYFLRKYITLLGYVTL